MKFHETAERRLLTILHCDVVDSTILVESLDAEEFLDLIESFLNGCQAIVERALGTVAAFTGDGFEAYFGYPVLSDSPAADALTAAIQIRDALVSNEFELSHPIACRIGVATGIVVVGEHESAAMGRNLTAFGPITHLAARLQSVAQTNQVFVDEETCKLSGVANIFNPKGDMNLKGFEKPIRTFEVTSSPSMQSRFDYSAVPMSLYSGRSKTMDLLAAKWRSVEQGYGQVVCICGEAGMGKSRSIMEFQSTLKGQGTLIYRFQCSNQLSSTPLHPWAHNMSLLAKFMPDDTNEEKREKLAVSLEEHYQLSEPHRELCENLLGIADSNEDLGAVSLPEKTIETLQIQLVEALLARSSYAPVLVVIEDIQWMDETSKYGLKTMIEQCADKHVCICLTTRPHIPLFEDADHISHIQLERLSKESVNSIITDLAAAKSIVLPDYLIEKIVQKSEGNPLFVEELTSMITEQPENWADTSLLAASIGRDSIPLTLQASLLSRIDRIKEGKTIAQIAAVVEENVTAELISEVSILSSDAIEAGFEALLSSNIMQRVSRGRAVHYEFRHALLKDAIYASLLKDRRRGIHLLIAQNLKLELEHNSSVRPELIAHHFQQAGDWGNAFGFWVTAGERALRSGASSEAVTLLENAQLHQQDAEQSAVHTHELQRMHMAYGRALNAIQGVAADPYKHFVAAVELGERLADTALTVAALDWQFGIDFNAGRLSDSRSAALKLRTIAHASNSSIAFVAGSQSLGMVNFMQGQFEDAESVFEEVLSKEKNLVSGMHCFPSMSLSYLAWSQYILGNSEAAKRSADRAIASSYNESTHAVATALSNCSYVYQCLGELTKLESCIHELIDHCEQNGERMYLCRGKILRHWIECRREHNPDGLSEINYNIDMLKEAEEEIELTYLYGLLADLQLFFGDFSGAHETLTTALALADKNQELFYYAELERMMALVQSKALGSNIGNDVLHWQCAIDTASEQGAKAWEEKANDAQRNFEQARSG